MSNTTGNKKDILNTDLNHIENESPDSLLVVEQARTGLYTLKENLLPKEASDGVLNQDGQAASSASAGGMRTGDLFNRGVQALSGIIPVKGDSRLEILRKCVFIIALITLMVSLSFIVNDMVLNPLNNQQAYDKVTELYTPGNPVPPPADFPEGNYPQGMSDSFKALYAQNQDIRGWIKYTDSNKKWLNINYPVMYHGDNDYYLSHDFKKEKNKNGALFFDKKTNLESYDAADRVLIIYGHNMASGQMFSPLNKLLNNHNYMRSAPLISLDTIYERGEYEVFSVMLLNTRDEDGPYFDYLRTDFGSDQDFSDFIANVRARSVYDFNGLDVQASDQLLILSTCTSLSNAHFKDGRCVVVARRVRGGESVLTHAADIVKNEDAIMPYAWYVNQEKALHPFYTDPSYKIPDTAATTPLKGSNLNTTTPTTYPWSYSWMTTNYRSGTTKAKITTNSGTTTTTASEGTTTTVTETDGSTTTTTTTESGSSSSATTTTTKPSSDAPVD